MPCVYRFLPIACLVLLIVVNLFVYSMQWLQVVAIVRTIQKLELLINDGFGWIREKLEKKKLLEPLSINVTDI